MKIAVQIILVEKMQWENLVIFGRGEVDSQPIGMEGDGVIPQRTRRGWEDETALEVNRHRFRFSSLWCQGLGNLRTSTEKGAAEDEIFGWHH